MKTLRALGLLVAGALALGIPVGAQKESALPEILRLAAEYHASYGPRVSGVALDERYTLIQLNAGRMDVPVRFASDVVLVNLNGRILGMRDPYAIDNVPLREKLPRITSLLTEPTAAAWQQALEYQHQSDFRFMSELILQMNDPMLALRFIASDAQPAMTYKLENQKKVNGVQVASVRFKENGEKGTTFMLGTRGNAAGSGRILIDVATGAIHKTELWADSETENVRVTVTYAFHATPGLWLPEKMNETYDWKEMADVASSRNVGAYGARQFFQSNAVYSSPRHTPIDLTKIRR